ncbi:MAG TPA: FKBP-type peptidyl-prolyl cis-trans isomerase [Caulobacteraceae bacterium]
MRMTIMLIASALLTGAPAAAQQATSGPRLGPDFLARNARARGVVTTPSGLQYRILESGPRSGDRPGATDQVTFHYEGRLLTGAVFDSSFERGQPLTGAVNRFVPGFTEALKLMRPGDEWVVFIPSALGYGDRAAGDIPPGSVLQFRLKLLSIGSPPST